MYSRKWEDKAAGQDFYIILAKHTQYGGFSASAGDVLSSFFSCILGQKKTQQAIKREKKTSRQERESSI